MQRGPKNEQAGFGDDILLPCIVFTNGYCDAKLTVDLK